MVKDLLSLLKEATLSVASEPRFRNLDIKDVPTNLDDLERLLREKSLTEYVLAEAALTSRRDLSPSSAKRDSLEFVANHSRQASELLYTNNSSAKWNLDPDMIRDCVISANKVTARLQVFSSLYGFDLFELLGLRNLSALMGEIFAKQVLLAYNSKFIKNPNQDGYPDLCALTPESKSYLAEITDEEGKVKTDKGLWSPYPYGGVEVKATCGNTPPAKVKAKPSIGVSRIETGLISADWKAHHRETKSLLGIFWDFVDTSPTYLAAFYRNDLTTDDWGKTIVPTEGSHTTSVSIMTGKGVLKMGKGWVVVPKKECFFNPLAKVFGISRPQLV